MRQDGAAPSPTTPPSTRRSARGFMFASSASKQEDIMSDVRRSSKRRTSDKSPHESAIKKSKHDVEIVADSEQKSSRLLDLPRELFDMILSHVAADAGAILRRNSTDLRSPSGLMGVSHSVRDQYQSVLNISALEIKTEVKEFDFSHIVKFFNKLSDRELSTLPTITLPSERKFIITLMPTAATNPESLHRWLLRLDSTTKKGTKIAADYTLPKRKLMSHMDGAPVLLTPTGWPILKTFAKWLRKLEEGKLDGLTNQNFRYEVHRKLLADSSATGRLRDEVGKIDAAIRKTRCVDCQGLSPFLANQCRNCFV